LFMTRIAYLECFSGVSGDMFLGALIDAGVPLRVLEEAVSALEVGAELRVNRVDRSGITATKVDVLVDGEPDRPRGSVEHLHPQDHKHAHEHSRLAHDHPEASVPQVHAPGLGVNLDDSEHLHVSRTGVSAQNAHGRHLSEIKRIIGAAKISELAKKKAIAIFEALGAAEAKIHNMEIERVHFHEVGAVDAMVDIVGAAVGAEALGVDAIVCSPLNVGGGTVKCAHGVFPVPAPATVELLKDAPVYSSGVQAELVTPTGAAIVKTLASRFTAFPAMRIEKTGYGAGTRDFAGHANVVRLTIGETLDMELPAGMRAAVGDSGISETPQADRDAASRVSSHDSLAAFAIAHTARETITVLEANLDDLSPQVFGYVLDKLLAEGALDAFGVPVQMKKNRPGSLLTVLCRPEDAAKLMHILFAETTTLGVRRRDEQRQVLTRRWESVSTQWGDVRIKIASMNGTVTNCAPEYEDCRKIAEEQHVPLKSVMLEALKAYTLVAARTKR
jgi:pyridinium-3,5-bisthiocarboxylic acid mononucleotide nickel chelatase